MSSLIPKCCFSWKIDLFFACNELFAKWQQFNAVNTQTDNFIFQIPRRVPTNFRRSEQRFGFQRSSILRRGRDILWGRQQWRRRPRRDGKEHWEDALQQKVEVLQKCICCFKYRLLNFSLLNSQADRVISFVSDNKWWVLWYGAAWFKLWQTVFHVSYP